MEKLYLFNVYTYCKSLYVIKVRSPYGLPWGPQIYFIFIYQMLLVWVFIGQVDSPLESICDGEGYSSIRERYDELETPSWWICWWLSLSNHLWMAVRCFGPSSLALVDYHLETGGMTLHDAVGKTVKGAKLLKIKEQVPIIWAKGCVFGDFVSI